VLVDLYLSLVPGAVLQKLLSRVTVPWHVVHLEEALPLGIVSVPCHKDIINSVLPGIQKHCKVTAKRMAYSRQIQNEGRDTKLLSCF
jgi:hypothetical protein